MNSVNHKLNFSIEHRINNSGIEFLDNNKEFILSEVRWKVDFIRDDVMQFIFISFLDDVWRKQREFR